jgi:hypothetical protein
LRTRHPGEHGEEQVLVHYQRGGGPEPVGPVTPVTPEVTVGPLGMYGPVTPVTPGWLTPLALTGRGASSCVCGSSDRSPAANAGTTATQPQTAHMAPAMTLRHLSQNDGRYMPASLTDGGTVRSSGLGLDLAPARHEVRAAAVLPKVRCPRTHRPARCAAPARGRTVRRLHATGSRWRTYVACIRNNHSM